MSEAQSPTATVTIQREPTEREIEVLKRIVVRAQNEPLANDRVSLLTAYSSVHDELNLNADEDDVCLPLLLEILNPGVIGETLFDKFESVLRARNIEVVFDDESRTTESNASNTGQKVISNPGSIQSPQTRSVSDASYQSSRDVTEQTEYEQHSKEEMDAWIDNPPPHYAASMQQAVHIDKRTLFRQVLDQVVEQVHGKRARVADTFYQERLRFKVLTHWHNVVQQLQNGYAEAEDFQNRYKLSQTLQKIFDSARINRVHAMEEERLRGKTLYQLTCESHNSVFKHKLELKLKLKYLQMVLGQTRDIAFQSQHREHILKSHQPNLNRWAAKSALFNMRDKIRLLSQLDADANMCNNLRGQRNIIHLWTAKTESFAAHRATADRIYGSHLMKQSLYKIYHKADFRLYLKKKYFEMWQKSIQARKRERYETEYRNFRKNHKMELTRKCLYTLKSKAEVLRHDEKEEEADAYRSKRMKKIMHAMFRKWFTSAQLLKEKDVNSRADEFAQKLRCKHFLRAIKNRHQQIHELQYKASKFHTGFHAVRVQVVSAQCLKTMGWKVSELRRRLKDANDHKEYQNKKMMRRLLDQWHRKAAEQRGEGPLSLPPATPAQIRATLLEELASTTPSYAPRTSFAARLRGEGRAVSEIEEEEEFDDNG